MKLVATIAGAAVLALIVTVAIGRSPALPLPPIPRPKPMELTDQPKPVRTIPITREAPRPVAPAAATAMPSAVPQVAALPKPQDLVEIDDERPAVKRRYKTRRALAGDICTRHGMRKVTAGRSWRCRR